MSPRPLFVTGTARSGSTLGCQVLSAHAQVVVASDPFLEMFRSLRTALLRDAALVPPSFDPRTPLQDHYFVRERVAELDAILEGDLAVRVEPAEWPDLLERTRVRASHESADLVEGLAGIRGPTYRDVIENALALIADARGGADASWVGFKDVWIAEFFAPLARAFPDARFLYVQRDPRGMLSSVLGAERSGTAPPAHVLSYLRHWRKGLALAIRHRSSGEIASRFRVLSYERLVADPEVEARALCDWLEVPFDSSMVDARRFIAYPVPEGRPWAGNSSFGPSDAITASPVDRWRHDVDAATLGLVDLTCGPDLAAAGYDPSGAVAAWIQASEVLELVIENGRDPNLDWRTDLGDPQLDYGLELFRRAALFSDRKVLGTDIVRRCFLFEEVFEELRTHGKRSP